MFDCFSLGLADRKSTVKIGDKSLGHLKAGLLRYALEGKQLKFAPFLKLLADYEDEIRKGEHLGLQED